MQNIKKYFMTLALLLTAATGAWAQDVDGTIAWSVGNEASATVSPSIKDAISRTSVTTGSGMNISTATYFSTTMASYRPTTANAGNVEGVMIEYTIEAVDGYKFKPTGVEYAAVQVGTDNASYSWSYTIDGVESAITDVSNTSVLRNTGSNSGTAQLMHTESITADGCSVFTLRFYISNCGNSKNIGIGNITISGSVSAASDASSATTVDIAWNASTKTGTFTMPGGNVELEVEYYPGMLTLPASLTGGTLSVVGLTAPFTKLEVLDAWENDNTLLSAAHLPGLKEMTDAEAENWTDVPNGYVILIYGFDGTKAKMATYIDGELTFPSTEDVTLSQLKTASADAELYYSSEAQMPVGFEKDEEGNIYVADKTEFQVKAVPAEGYRLASLMFGETDVTDQVDADGIATLTMPEGNIDLELTATFSNEYTVALNAEGLSDEEAANWKAATGDNDPAALPLENVKYGTEVKVTYTGTKKVIGVKAEKKAKAATLADALVDGATVVIAFSYGYLSTNTFTNNNGTFTLTDATGFGAADDETTQLTADGSNLIFKANWDTSIDKNWSNLGFQVTIDTTDNTYVVWKSDTAQGYSAKFTSITVNGTEIQLSEMK